MASFAATRFARSSDVVERATTPQQKIYYDLCDRPNLKLSYFSVPIVQADKRESAKEVKIAPEETQPPQDPA